MKTILGTIGLVCFLVLVIVLIIRGNVGNIGPADFSDKYWTDNGPLELSPERGRFALIYSIVEDGSLQFSREVAQLGSPDVAVRTDGKYVSLFAPGVSLVALPGYLIGKWFGMSLVGVFAVISVFAIINTLLVIFISQQLGANKLAATFGGLIFLLATPALAYSVDLYQHHISVFLILFSILGLLKWPGYRALLITFFMFGVSIIIDNPNIIMMIPLVIAGIAQIISIKVDDKKIKINLKFWRLLTGFIVIIPLLGFLWYNFLSHNNPWQLSGTLPSLHEVDTNGEIFISDVERISAPKLDVNTVAENKSAVGFFETRNLLDGFYTHFLSQDRGIIYFTPVMLLVFPAAVLLYRRRTPFFNVLLGVMFLNILLYSLWGDYYGGWAFGSRYLIPSYALGAIMLAISLHYWRRYIIWSLIVLTLTIYSTSINILGAVTSSANPPKIEVLELEQLSGKVQRYSYDRNWELLTNGKIKSVLYRGVFQPYMSTQEYYYLILSLVIPVIFSLMIWYMILNLRNKKGESND